MNENYQILEKFSPFATFAPRLTIIFFIVVLGNTMSLSVPLALTLLSELNGFKQNWEKKKGSFSEIQKTLSLAHLVKVLAFPNSPHCQ